MTDLIFYKKCLNFLIVASFLALFFYGTYDIFKIYYVLMYCFMVVRTFRINTKKSVKAYLLSLDFILLIAQLIFANEFFNTVNSNAFVDIFGQIFCVAMITLPMLFEKIVTVKKYIGFRLPSIEEFSAISYSEVKDNRNKLKKYFSKIQNAEKNLTPKNIYNIIEDLPRHNSFQYVNNGCLTEEYFNRATESLTDNHIYFIVSNTGTPASQVLSVFTQKQFNHISLSFDRDLKTIISYNGGEKIYPPGLNYEMVKLFMKKEDSSILIYSLECTLEQKTKILNKIKQINNEGSAYNVLGLVLKQSYKPNIMFCSQFVYKMLEIADLSYFQKNPTEVKPTDFIELDYYRKLNFEFELINKDNSTIKK